MCEFHGSNGNGFGDIWWTDNPIYFSSIDSMRGYNTRGDAGRCCTKAPYYASSERTGKGGLEVGDQVYTWVRPRWRDEIQMMRHPIAVLSEEVEQYLETPNQAFISRPWTSSKKSSVSFVCIDLSPYVAEGRTTERNKLASIAGDIFDRGMRAATLAQAAMPLFLR